MISSKEMAYSKLSIWKNSSTVLKLSVVVDFAFDAPRQFQMLNLSKASFLVTDSSVKCLTSHLGRATGTVLMSPLSTLASDSNA